MCPEKERYMRETRNQLSVYEVVINTEMVMFEILYTFQNGQIFIKCIVLFSFSLS